MLRWIVDIHTGFSINSFAHLWGLRPYDKNILPAENHIVSAIAIGEAFHNYHHAFPFDYGTSELGWYFNLTKMFIDAMAAIGWAYDLKTATPNMIRSRKERTGDEQYQQKGAYGTY